VRPLRMMHYNATE